MDRPEPSGGARRAGAPERARGDVDLTGVDPLRLKEIRRRIDVVKAYLRIAEPDDADKARHAEELGLGVSQFLALVRSWREAGRAADMYGAGAAKRKPRPSGSRNLPSASKAAAAQVIEALGPGASLVETVRLVKERCGALRVACPSRNTIWNMLMAHRSAHGAGGDEGVVVSRCHAKLPVQCGTEVEFPSIVLAVEMSSGTVLEGVMEPDPLLAVRMATAIERLADGPPAMIDEDLAPSIAALTGAGIEPVKATTARTATARALGRGIGRLDLVYLRGKSVDPSALLRSRKDSVVEREDARRFLAEQIAAHNATRRMAPPARS